MNKKLLICLALQFSACVVAQGADESISQLEDKLVQIEAELNQLSALTMRGGVGSIGFHSKKSVTPDQKFWFEIDLGAIHDIDQIVVVPVLWRNSNRDYAADAFPRNFQVLAGSEDQPEGVVIAEYKKTPSSVLGTAPLVLSVPSTRASWVRIEIPKPFARMHDGMYVFQFSEIMVFSDMTNVALRRPVKTSAPKPPDPSGAWDTRFLVDGAMPYVMSSTKGHGSIAYVSDFGAQPSLYIDMDQPQTISQINLHAVDQGDTVPQAFPSDLGIPRHFHIEGANKEDFSDAVLLLDYRWKNVADTSPIMMWNIPETTCRYVRLVVDEPSVSVGVSKRLSRVGFAEIELIHGGINVARGSKVWADPASRSDRVPLTLTDGRNLFGNIIPVRVWVNQLARRQQLEQERSDIRVSLDRLYARQNIIYSWLSKIIIALVFVITFTILYDRIIRTKRETELRQRIAANLHDELGANMHALGMLSDIASESIDKPDRLVDTVGRIRRLTERTSDAARYCVNMLETDGLYDNLIEDMDRDASRLLADIEYEFSHTGREYLDTWSRRQRIDLALFFKEALANVLRHAHSSKVTINLVASKKNILLEILDNGTGTIEQVPPSLQRRARLMRAKTTIDHPSDGGTSVKLKIARRRLGFFI